MFRVFVFVSILTLLFSCKGVEYSETAVSGYDGPLKENGEGLSVQYTPIALEELQGSMLTNPQKIVLTDSLILISDDNRLLSFGLDGKYHGQIGCMGRGNGEYINLTTFYVDNKKAITIFDSYRNVLLRFSLDGKPICETSLGDLELKFAQSILPLSDKELFVYNYLYNDSHLLAEIVNIETGETEEVASTPMCTNSTMEYVGRNPYCSYGGKIRYLQPLDNRIYSLGDSTTLCINTKQTVYNEKELQDIKNFGMTTYADCLNENRFAGFSDVFETERYIVLACHNASYTVVDKKTMSCKRFKYSMTAGARDEALYNIRGVYKNSLVGFFGTDDIEKLSSLGFDTPLAKSVKRLNSTQVLVLQEIL